MPNVYFIHFSKSYGGRKHYIGCTRGPAIMRFEEHAAGKGGLTTKRALKAGVKLKLVGWWEDVPWSFEREVKKHRKLRPWCPYCHEELVEKIEVVRGRKVALQLLLEG